MRLFCFFFNDTATTVIYTTDPLFPYTPLVRSWVLLRTDWSKRSVDDYVNRRDDGAHTPGPSVEAVRFLIEERDAHGLGVETIGTDAGQAHLLDPPYTAHALFQGAGRYELQCLANLDQLPPTGPVVVASPLQIKCGSGSNLWVLAFLESYYLTGCSC